MRIRTEKARQQRASQQHGQVMASRRWPNPSRLCFGMSKNREMQVVITKIMRLAGVFVAISLQLLDNLPLVGNCPGQWAEGDSRVTRMARDPGARSGPKTPV